MGYIAGIGGANMDIHGKSDRQLIMRDSNPGSLHTSLGGVCRNICENLARLGETVRLITVVGDDVQGRGIIEGCEKAGIDMSATRVLRGERSSSYISIMDGDGDMLLAMSDMHIIKQLNAQLVDESRDLLCGADLVVCDGNLSARTIERLSQICDRPLYLDPVSTAWARELKPYIGCFDTIKPNRMELEVLSDCPVDTPENVEMACDIVRGKGVRRVFVSLGKDGMYLQRAGGRHLGCRAARLTAWLTRPARATRRWRASFTPPVRAIQPKMSSRSAWARAWLPFLQATPSAARCLPRRLKIW